MAVDGSGPTLSTLHDPDGPATADRRLSTL
jgi:hypothetical protein